MAQQGINMTNSKQMGGSFSKAEKRKQKNDMKSVRWTSLLFEVTSDSCEDSSEDEGWWLLN